MPLISFDTPQRFSDVFRGYQKRSLAWNGLRITLCSSIRIDRHLVILFTSIRILIDSLPPKCKCNMGMRPIKKFLFKLIYNGNIFPAFRKLIPSICYSEIKAINALGIKFRKNHSATWSETVLLKIWWTILKTNGEAFSGN